MPTSSTHLRERLVEYAWRAWSCLGVAGWEHGSFAGCVDIDALVLLTGLLGDDDARLRDESIDWCVSNVALVSRSRLAHLLRDTSPNPAWVAYAGTLQAATKQRWPGAGLPFEWIPSHKSRPSERRSGSTLGLHCRALFGATARGEVVRILLMEDGDRPLDVRDIASEARYTKRAIAEALDNLRLAGIVRAIPFGNSNRHVLQCRAELEALLGPGPRLRSSQRATCRVLWAIARVVEENSNVSERVQRVEIARLAGDLQTDIRRIDPQGRVVGTEAPTLDALAAWGIARCDEVLAPA